MAGRHQVRVRPEREAWVFMTQELRKLLNGHSAREQDRGVEVPHRVHAVLPIRVRQSCALERRRPHDLVEQVAAVGLAVLLGDEQVHRHELPVGLVPRQRHRNDLEQFQVVIDLFEHTGRHRRLPLLVPLGQREDELSVDDSNLPTHVDHHVFAVDVLRREAKDLALPHPTPNAQRRRNLKARRQRELE